MILYFSGTGNSAYVAKKIGQMLDEPVVNLFDKIRNKDYSEITSESPWVIVSPTYAWRLPRIVQDWLKNTQLSGDDRVYFVLTCGDSVGNASMYAKLWCFETHKKYMGCAQIVMPENYIAMFKAPDVETSKEIVGKAKPVIETIAECIKNGEMLAEDVVKWQNQILNWIKSSIVNPVFYALCVKARQFRADDRCNGCGLCEKNCPMNNIRMVNHKPKWNRKCTHCMACICKCPEEVIEYGKVSVGQVRYQCLEE